MKILEIEIIVVKFQNFGCLEVSEGVESIYTFKITIEILINLQKKKRKTLDSGKKGLGKFVPSLDFSFKFWLKKFIIINFRLGELIKSSFEW